MTCDGFSGQCDGENVGNFTIRKRGGLGRRAVCLCQSCVRHARAAGFDVTAVVVEVVVRRSG